MFTAQNKMSKEGVKFDSECNRLKTTLNRERVWLKASIRLY